MKRLLKKAAALAAGWASAVSLIYLPFVLLFGIRKLGILVPDAAIWLTTAIFIGSLAASPWFGCRVFERVARKLGVARASANRPGFLRKLAAYFAGVGTAAVIFGVAFLLVLGTPRFQPSIWREIHKIWLFVVYPATPFLSLLATRAIQGGGREAEPGAPAAGAAPAAAATPAPEPPDPPLLRIAPV